MAEIRRNRRTIESIDPVTGERVYRDEVTGEVVSPDITIVNTPDGTVVVSDSDPRTEVTEQVVTERYTPGQQIVTQRTVSGPAAPVTTIANTHTQESEVYIEDPYEHRRARAYRLQQAIYLVFGILEALLAIRFVLRLLSANPNSGFASMIYGITAPFMAPFVGVFGQPALGGAVLEWNALVAIAAYALLAWVLVKIVWLAGGETRSGVRTSRVHTRIDK